MTSAAAGVVEPTGRPPATNSSRRVATGGRPVCGQPAHWRPVRDAQLAAAGALRWPGDRPVVLGGKFNIRHLSLGGFDYAGGHEVDHIFGGGLSVQPAGADVLDRGRLSDHASVRVRLN